MSAERDAAIAGADKAYNAAIAEPLEAYNAAIAEADKL